MPRTIKVPEEQFREMEESFEEMKKEIEEWKATFETLSNKDVMESIEKSKKAAEEGREKSWDEIKEDLKD